MIVLTTDLSAITVICRVQGITSEDHIDIIKRIAKQFRTSTFQLTQPARNAIKSPEMTDQNLSVIITRLVKKGAIIKHGRMYGLSPAFSLLDTKQILIKIK